MKKLIVLVGVRGAGKSTAASSFQRGRVLKPSTDRAPRGPTDTEYHFESTWDFQAMAWSIVVGSNNYGMRRTELDAISDLGITVFDPGNIATLNQSKIKLEFEVVTVGLDTISTITEQHTRVGSAPSRQMSDADFQAQREIVSKCDLIIRGDASTITEALNELSIILTNRGGVLNGGSIRKFLSAGALLRNWDGAQIQAASYDLRLADTYWCQGKYHTLTPESPVAKIPPYSFAFVQSIELAALPRFVCATFDIKVGLFFSGVVLSNGPQVDPGYEGALFCMLHNASGSSVGINRGAHFSTIEFQTLAVNSTGYSAQHQRKTSITDFLDGSAAVKPGGRILEYVDERSEKVLVEFRELRTTHWAIAALILAAGLWLADKAISAIDKASENMAKMEAATQSAKDATARAEKVADEGASKIDAALLRVSEGARLRNDAASKKPTK